jgi:hypothetical protein
MDIEDQLSSQELLNIALSQCSNVFPYTAVIGEAIFDGILVIFQDTDKFSVSVDSVTRLTDGHVFSHRYSMGYFPLGSLTLETIDVKGIIRSCFAKRAFENINHISKLMQS